MTLKERGFPVETRLTPRPSQTTPKLRLHIIGLIELSISDHEV